MQRYLGPKHKMQRRQAEYERTVSTLTEALVDAKKNELACANVLLAFQNNQALDDTDRKTAEVALAKAMVVTRDLDRELDLLVKIHEEHFKPLNQTINAREQVIREIPFEFWKNNPDFAKAMKVRNDQLNAQMAKLCQDIDFHKAAKVANVLGKKN